MDNLNLGWQFALLVLLLEILYYFIVASFYYILVASLATLLGRLMNKTTTDNKNDFIRFVTPLFLSSLIIGIIKSYIFPLFGSFLSWDGMFLNTGYYFLPGIYAFVTGMTCLSLTRYSYIDGWLVQGSVKRKKTILNFIIWTTLMLLITIIFREIVSLFLSDLIAYLLIYPGLIILFTYLFLKKRNFEKV